VRRKTAFLLNALLLQDGPSPEEEEADPIKLPPSVHANLPSHFPPSTQTTTNGTARAAFQSSGILITLLHSLVSPVPHGPDGDGVPDADFEEKAIRVILTFVQLESTSPSPTLKGKHGLNEEQRGLLAQLLKSTGKESGLVRWNLVEEEWATLEASL
jgi:hsp70-interacting protein